jgi:hypothetical protein
MPASVIGRRDADDCRVERKPDRLVQRGSRDSLETCRARCLGRKRDDRGQLVRLQGGASQRCLHHRDSLPFRNESGHCGRVDDAGDANTCRAANLDPKAGSDKRCGSANGRQSSDEIGNGC